MHGPEWICLIAGLVAGFQVGSRTILGRLSRVERRARARSLRSR